MLPSCDNLNRSLMSKTGVIDGIGECEYEKHKVCWHEMVTGWDSFLYNDPGSCALINNDDYTLVKKK